MNEREALFDRIGVRRVVNGVGPATRLGGLPLHPEVIRAMAEATEHPVRMDELERRAGAHLAELFGVEAAYVTSGAAAAISLATAAALMQRDPGVADALPRGVGTRKRVLVLAAHRDPYDRAVEAAGGEIATVGYPASTHLGEIDRALDDTAAALLYRPGREGNHPSLAEICALAQSWGVPVIVDGALYAPPLDRLRRWFEDGASLVAMSGGKQFRGPQASGVLCGRAALIDLVGLVHQDMDEREATWGRNEPNGPHRTPPRHGIGRGMKVGREQIAGLVVAVERYIAHPGAEETAGVHELANAYELLAARGVPVRWHETSVLGVPVLDVEVGKAGHDVDRVLSDLMRAPLPVYLEESEAWRGVLMVHPMALTPGDGERIADALTAALGGEVAHSADDTLADGKGEDR